MYEVIMKLKLALLIGLFHALSAKAQFNHRDIYGTHQPVLYEIAMRTSGPIIEFGCGNSSTDLLHEICKQTNRILISVDDDLGWLSKFSQKYLGDGYLSDNSGWHKFFFVPGKHNSSAAHWITFLETCELLKTLNFDLCFVDQSPWQARTETILRMKDKVKYLILHDCDGFACEPLGETIQPIDGARSMPGIYDFSKAFRYFKLYWPLKPWPGQSGPPTLLGSNFESDLPDIDYNNY